MARDLNLLHPETKKKAEPLIELCLKNGIEIIITQTLRTKAEQDGYYAQGRTIPGDVVTGVKYPYSNHCWGTAFDFAVKVGGEITWNKTYYNKVGPIGKSLGLEWGGTWKHQDSPHFQLPGYEAEDLVKKYGTLEKFRATWEEEEAVEEKRTVFANENTATKGGINSSGKACVPIAELIETFDLNLVVGYENSTIYVRRKKEGE